MGFPKASKIFKGNVSESDTLIEITEALQGKKPKEDGVKKTKKDITVVLDAGITKEENLTLLKREGYDYICVARNKPVKISEMKMDDLITVKADGDSKVEAQLIRKSGENILYCKSLLKVKKEEAMKNLYVIFRVSGLDSAAYKTIRQDGEPKRTRRWKRRILPRRA